MTSRNVCRKSARSASMQDPGLQLDTPARNVPGTALDQHVCRASSVLPVRREKRGLCVKSRLCRVRRQGPGGGGWGCPTRGSRPVRGSPRPGNRHGLERIVTSGVATPVTRLPRPTRVTAEHDRYVVVVRIRQRIPPVGIPVDPPMTQMTRQILSPRLPTQRLGQILVRVVVRANVAAHQSSPTRARSVAAVSSPSWLK